MTHEVKNIFSLVLYRECLSTPVLSGDKDVVTVIKRTITDICRTLALGKHFANPLLSWCHLIVNPLLLLFSKSFVEGREIQRRKVTC